jgi:hypothetical protein
VRVGCHAILVYLERRWGSDNQSCCQPPDLMPRDWACVPIDLGLSFSERACEHNLKFGRPCLPLQFSLSGIEIRGRGNEGGDSGEVYYQ